MVICRYDGEVNDVVDVSSKVKLDKAYLRIFSEYIVDIVEEELKQDRKDDLNTRYKEHCDICDKTGEIEVKGKKFFCPECRGLQKVKTDKNVIEFHKLYNEACGGNGKAAKRFVEKHRDYYGVNFQIWEL